MKIWTGHYGSVLGLSYAPGGKSLASCSTDGRVIVWACPSYTQRALCVCRGKVDSLAWVSRKVLATNSPGLSAALPELAVGGGADATEGCVTLWYVPTGAADPLPLCTLRHEVSPFVLATLVASVLLRFQQHRFVVNRAEETSMRWPAGARLLCLPGSARRDGRRKWMMRRRRMRSWRCWRRLRARPTRRYGCGGEL